MGECCVKYVMIKKFKVRIVPQALRGNNRATEQNKGHDRLMSFFRGSFDPPPPVRNSS